MMAADAETRSTVHYRPAPGSTRRCSAAADCSAHPSVLDLAIRWVYKLISCFRSTEH